MNLQEQIIDEFRKEFGSIGEETYLVQHNDREMCMYCGHPSSRDAVFRNLEDFILKALKQQEEQVRGEVKEEILKALNKELNDSSVGGNIGFVNDRYLGFVECRERFLSIIEKI